MVAKRWSVLCCVIGLAVAVGRPLCAADIPQYTFEDIHVPKAYADEPTREQFSLAEAARYLDQGAKAWIGAHKCVSCHTSGTYMLIRPELSKQLGPPSAAMRDTFVAVFHDLAAMKRDDLQKSTRPGQVIYAAAGLAEWDKHVAKSLSPETAQALKLMFSLQNVTGTWGSADCWPPYESDAFHEATVAAMAVADAPGWLATLQDPALRTGVERLQNYLRTQTPPHDYGRVLLLWASTRMPGLLDKQQQHALVEMIWKHQQADGGWSLRTFAAPEAWGRGNRADKLRGEPEFNHPPSDGHMTGMALVALREAGTPTADPRIQRGVHWLLKNQRTSGRWWTRSLNTDSRHFITYSGTALPLLALNLCDALTNDGPVSLKDTGDRIGPVKSADRIEFAAARSVYDAFNGLPQEDKMKLTSLRLERLFGRPSQINLQGDNGSYFASWGHYVGKTTGGRARKSHSLVARFTASGNISLWILRKPELQHDRITDDEVEHFVLLGGQWFNITLDQ